MSVDDAVRRIREETDLEPRAGVVLGSGLGGLADELEERVEIPYSEILGWPVSTAVGHAGTLMLGTLGGVPIAVMCGRAHLYEGIPADRVAFGVRVLGRLGIRSLVVTNAAGGINVDFRPGLLVLISDHVNLQGTSSLVGPNDDSLGPRFPDMSDAYDAALRAQAREAAARLGIELGEGVYAAWLGPQFETPAEIRFMRAVGGDLAGMSTVQEVIAARHMGVRVLGISVVTNMAAGVTSGTIDHEAVLEVGAAAAGSLTALLRELVPTLSSRSFATCPLWTSCSATSGWPRSRTSSRSRPRAPFSGGRERRSRPGPIQVRSWTPSSRSSLARGSRPCGAW